MRPSSNVIIVDDVTTKGTSVADAVKKVEDEKCSVIEIITLVDREEGARERLRDYRFTPIFSKSQFPSFG